METTLIIPTTRICYICKVEKTLDLFYKASNEPLGRAYRCKDCCKEYNKSQNRKDTVKKHDQTSTVKLWRNKYNKGEKRKIVTKRYCIKNKNYRLWISAKRRAIKKGLEFTITKDDIIIPDVCPILGIPLCIDNSKQSANSASLDRVDNSKGYTPDNICVISSRANTIKSSGSIEEHQKIIEYMKKFIQLPVQ